MTEKERQIITCTECGSDFLKGIWNGSEEYIDLECHNCGQKFTNNRTTAGVFELETKGSK